MEQERLRRAVESVEEALREAEARFGVSITIVDHAGLLRWPGGRSLLGHDRQSHRKNPICLAAFGPPCILHCRHEIGAICRERGNGEPFLHDCWKGARELVVPLFLDGTFVAAFFAGIWRGNPPQEDVAARVKSAREALPPEPEEAEMRSLRVLLSFLAHGMLSTLAEVLAFSGKQEGRAAQVQRFFSRRYQEDVGLEDLARELHLSTSRTSHLVIELLGDSFQNLLRRTRVESAQAFLEASDMRVHEIAAAVGMTDPYYFSRVFREVTGVSPREYRQHVRKSATGIQTGTA